MEERARREKLLSAAAKPAEVIFLKYLRILYLDFTTFLLFCRILHLFCPCQSLMRRSVYSIGALILCFTIPITHAQTSHKRELRR